MTEKKTFSFSHQAMGTFFEVFVAGQAEDYSRSAADAFFREIDRLEGFFSRFDDRSEISRINRLKPGEILPIGLETYECLKLSFELMVETGGAFNINFRAVKQVAEIMGKGTGTAAEEKKVESYLALFPLELIEQGGNYAAIRLDVAGAELDLDPGAIGKGYALEKASSIFSLWGIEDFLVSAGGSTVYACGSEPWPVSVGGGFDFFQPGKIYLKERALSGSGHEVKGEHIFDPRKKCQKSRHLAAWVSHPSPAVADALSTAFMAMGLEEISKYTESHPEVWALVLTRNKKSHRFKEVEFFEKGD